MPLHFKVKLNNVNEHLVNKKQDQFALFIILRLFRSFVKVKGNNLSRDEDERHGV